MTTTTVTCPDGEVRHEPFDSPEAAWTWADMGHFCLAAHLHDFSRAEVAA